MGACFEDGRLPGGAVPEADVAFRYLQVVLGVVEVADVGTGDGGRDGEHDVAEHALVLGPEGRLRTVDYGAGRDGVGRGADHRPEDALQEVQ